MWKWWREREPSNQREWEEEDRMERMAFSSLAKGYSYDSESNWNAASAAAAAAAAAAATAAATVVGC